MAALGAETPSGDFEVLEFCFAGLPPQAGRKPAEGDGEWVALISGLEMGAASEEADQRAAMLGEWLSGEIGGDEVGRLLARRGS